MLIKLGLIKGIFLGNFQTKNIDQYFPLKIPNHFQKNSYPLWGSHFSKGSSKCWQNFHHQKQKQKIHCLWCTLQLIKLFYYSLLEFVLDFKRKCLFLPMRAPVFMKMAVIKEFLVLVWEFHVSPCKSTFTDVISLEQE